jgi:o-succinylbenzoate synthase
MKIEQVSIVHLALPLVHPFQTSFGTERARELLLVAVHSAGLTGWGECVATAEPGFSYETVNTAWHILTDFIVPALLEQEQEIDAPEDIIAHYRWIRGHPMAKAAIEGAVWDLLAQAQDVTLADKLAPPGRYETPRRERVPVGVSVGVQPTLDDLLDRIQHFVDAGYRRIKIKIKPGWDREPVHAVRTRFPDLPLMVDANSAYTLADAPLFEALDVYDLLMIEQPLAYDDMVDHAKLQTRLRTPLCLDESIVSPAHARWALELGACRIINIKVGRVGGLAATRQIHDLAYDRGVPVWCGGMLETGVGRAANVAVASLPNYTLPGDLSATARYYDPDIADPPFVLNPDSTLSVPAGPGLGVTVDRERLERVTLRQVQLK